MLREASNGWGRLWWSVGAEQLDEERPNTEREGWGRERERRSAKFKGDEETPAEGERNSYRKERMKEMRGGAEVMHTSQMGAYRRLPRLRFSSRFMRVGGPSALS